MPNLLIPVEERSLTPAEVELLDARRRRGHLFLVLGWQTLVVTALVGLLWVGLDLTHSPGWEKVMTYWAVITGTISIGSFLTGISLRRGFHEFTSF